MNNSAITLKNVSFAYPFQKPILNNISLEIKNKQFVGIVGPNGAGKSTLLKLMIGFLKPLQGEIYLKEKNINIFNEWSQISYVSQKASSFNTSFPATVQEVIAAPLLSKKNFPKIPNKMIKNKITEVLAMVDLEHYKNFLIGNLSGGQQQRVFLARALITNPQILFLDEPFVGIDHTSQKSISTILAKINNKGTTLVMVTHDLRWVQNEVDLLVCVEKGTVHFHRQTGYVNKKLDNHNHLIYHQHN